MESSVIPSQKFHIKQTKSGDISIRLARFLRKLPPYKVASTRDQKSRESALKLDWNEGTIPPAPSVISAIKHALDNTNAVNWYPDIYQEDLKNQLASFHGTDASAIEVFAGSDNALDYLAKIFVDPGDKVQIVSPTYDQFRVSLSTREAIISHIYCKNPFRWTGIEIAKQIMKDTKLLYLVNPNNPTGCLLEKEEIELLLKSNPHTFVIIDEAYMDFSKNNTSMDLVMKYNNLVILRTFSKAFCLAGLRIGYMISNSVCIDAVRKIKNVKEVNSLALVAATTALQEWQYYSEYIDTVNKTKREFADALQKLGYEVNCGYGNYLMVLVEHPQEFINHLVKKNIYIRDRSYLPQLSGYVRITVGTQQQMKKVLKVIRAYSR